MGTSITQCCCLLKSWCESREEGFGTDECPGTWKSVGFRCGWLGQHKAVRFVSCELPSCPVQSYAGRVLAPTSWFGPWKWLQLSIQGVHLPRPVCVSFFFMVIIVCRQW